MTNQIPTLSEKERVILELLTKRGSELYGLELVQLSGGTLRRGTVYVTLSRMEEKGFITSRQEERSSGQSGLPRRLYKPTGYGVKVLHLSNQLHELAMGRLVLGVT